MNQPGQNFIGDNYLTCDEIEPNSTINAFGREFEIQGVDIFTQMFFKEKYGKNFDDCRDGSSNTMAIFESSRTAIDDQWNPKRKGWA